MLIYKKMFYQLIEKMKVDELKHFLRLRGLRVRRNKSELVARVFCAKSQQTTGGGSIFFPVFFFGA